MTMQVRASRLPTTDYLSITRPTGTLFREEGLSKPIPLML